MCCAIDRANIGNAKIEGMATDLHLIGYRYNIILSIFFIVYLRYAQRFYLLTGGDHADVYIASKSQATSC